MGKVKGLSSLFNHGDEEKTIDMGQSDQYSVPIPEKLPYSVYKVHGVGMREEQQDAFATSQGDDVDAEKGFLAIVADGMGGMSCGDKASMATVISCLEYFDSCEEFNSEYLKEMAYRANDEVLRALLGYAGSSGSTLTAVYLNDNELEWVSVGDSRIVLIRDGELFQLNTFHNYGTELDIKAAKGEITYDEAQNASRRHALTSYIGIEDLDKVDVSKEPISLEKNDVVILMSDGVYGTISDDNLIDAADFAGPNVAKHIIMNIEAQKKKNQDNYTALIIRYEG